MLGEGALAGLPGGKWVWRRGRSTLMVLGWHGGVLLWAQLVMFVIPYGTWPLLSGVSWPFALLVVVCAVVTATLLGVYGLRHVLIVTPGGVWHLTVLLGLPLWAHRWGLDPRIGATDILWDANGEVVELPGGVELFPPRGADALLEEIREAVRLALGDASHGARPGGSG